METTPQIGSQITITVELAQAAAKIAERRPDGAIRIEYREDQPENLWHVIALGVTDEETKEYVVNDETGAIHDIDCDLDDDCMCRPFESAPALKPLKLTRAHREALTRCVMHNGWTMTEGSAAQAMAAKLEAHGLVTRNESGTAIYITEKGREVLGPV